MPERFITRIIYIAGLAGGKRLMNEFAWTDIAVSGELVIQKNDCGNIRIVNRKPVGSATPADVPLAQDEDLAKLFKELARIYGLAVAINRGQAYSIGFRS